MTPKSWTHQGGRRKDWRGLGAFSFLFPFFMLYLMPSAHGLGTFEVRGLFDSLRPKSGMGLEPSWEAALPVRLSWEFGRWAEAQATWGWGGGSYALPGRVLRSVRGAIPLGFSLRARAGVPDGTWATGMVGFSSAGDLALHRGLRTDSYVPDTRPEDRLLGGGRTLRMEAGAESRLGRGRWRVTLWTEDEGSFPAEGVSARLDPGTAGGVRFQGRLGPDKEEKVALTLGSERRPSYRTADPAGSMEVLRAHTRNEIRLEGWTSLGKKLSLGLILMESDRSGQSLPASKGSAPALWPVFRSGPTLEAVLGLRHWMPGNANAFYSAGNFRASGNGAPIGTDIRDDGWRGYFVAAEAEAALSAATGAGWKMSWTRTRDEGASPDSSPGEVNRVRSRLRLELLVYRIF